MRVRLRSKEWCLANGWSEDKHGMWKNNLQLTRKMIIRLNTCAFVESRFGPNNTMLSDGFIWPNELIYTKQDIINEFFKKN